MRMQSFDQGSDPSQHNWIVEQAKDVAELVVYLNTLTRDGLRIHSVMITNDVFTILAAMDIDEIYCEQCR
jgi:hypothetical protein